MQQALFKFCAQLDIVNIDTTPKKRLKPKQSKTERNKYACVMGASRLGSSSETFPGVTKATNLIENGSAVLGRIRQSNIQCCLPPTSIRNHLQGKFIKLSTTGVSLIIPQNPTGGCVTTLHRAVRDLDGRRHRVSSFAPLYGVFFKLGDL